MGWRRWIFGDDPGPQLPGPAAAKRPTPAEDPVWRAVRIDLEHLAEASLGNRSAKVITLLRRAEATRAGMYAAVDEIPELSVLFVDQSRLKDLAAEMRGRLAQITTV